MDLSYILGIAYKEITYILLSPVRYWNTLEYLNNKNKLRLW